MNIFRNEGMVSGTGEISGYGRMKDVQIWDNGFSYRLRGFPLDSL